MYPSSLLDQVLLHRYLSTFVRCQLVFFILAFSILTHADSEPPTDPANLVTTILSDSAVEVSWDRSTDNKRVRNYLVYVDGEIHVQTRHLDYVVTDLAADTAYIIGVSAWDGFNESGQVTTRVITLPANTDEPGCVP